MLLKWIFDRVVSLLGLLILWPVLLVVNDSQKATLAFIKKHEGCRAAMIRK